MSQKLYLGASRGHRRQRTTWNSRQRTTTSHKRQKTIQNIDKKQPLVTEDDKRLEIIGKESSLVIEDDKILPENTLPTSLIDTTKNDGGQQTDASGDKEAPSTVVAYTG